MKRLRALMTVMRKELRDIFRDRRTLLLALVLGPLLIPVLILGMGTLAEKPRTAASSRSRWNCRWSAPSTRPT